MKNTSLFFIGPDKYSISTINPFPVTNVLRSMQTKAFMLADLVSDTTAKGQVAKKYIYLVMAAKRIGGAYE